MPIPYGNDDMKRKQPMFSPGSQVPRKLFVRIFSFQDLGHIGVLHSTMLACFVLMFTVSRI